MMETEVLREHSHQVLHVSFSHSGKMFVTCSKDGLILVSFYFAPNFYQIKKMHA
jgi:WD40 repeat protein